MRSTKYSSLSAISSSLQRELEQRIVGLAELRQHLVAHRADDRRARIEVLVDAMAEAHQAEVVVLVLGLGQILRHVLDGADLLEHREHRFVRAAVRRTPQRRDAGGDRCVRIRAGAAGETHGRGAGVLLVIGVQDEQQIERLRSHRIDVVRLARHGEEHVQQVRAVVEIVARIDERLAERVLVGRRGDRRNLRDDAMREDLAMARVMDVHRVVIERRHRRDHARQHRHRVRVVLKAVEESQQRFVDHRVVLDRVRELGELLAGRQFAVDQQVGDLEEIALLRQLLDRNARGAAARLRRRR